MPPKAAGKAKGKGKGGGDDYDGAPSGTCNQVKVRENIPQTRLFIF